jgi:hypothetical protein
MTAATANAIMLSSNDENMRVFNPRAVENPQSR